MRMFSWNWNIRVIINFSNSKTILNNCGFYEIPEDDAIPETIQLVINGNNNGTSIQCVERSSLNFAILFEIDLLVYMVCVNLKPNDGYNCVSFWYMSCTNAEQIMPIFMYTLHMTWEFNPSLEPCTLSWSLYSNCEEWQHFQSVCHTSTILLL